MSGISPALGVISKFIDIGKEIAKLPALVLPQYKSAATDFYQICQKLLKVNENLSRWLHRFRYLDLSDLNATSLAFQEYRSKRPGPEFQQMKPSCYDISNIYYRDISSKIGLWFSNQQKREEAEGIFNRLTDADEDMVSFVFDIVISRLDKFVDEVENEFDVGNLNRAEELRLKFKSETKEIAQQLEKFSSDLSDLTISFAKIARVPITLGV